METKQPIGTSTCSIALREHGGYLIRYRPDQRRQATICLAAAEERGAITRAECEALVNDVLFNTWPEFEGPIQKLER